LPGLRCRWSTRVLRLTRRQSVACYPPPPLHTRTRPPAPSLRVQGQWPWTQDQCHDYCCFECSRTEPCSFAWTFATDAGGRVLAGAAVTGPLSTRATRAAPTMAGATQTHVGTIAAMAPAGPRHRRHHLRQSRRRRSGSLRRSRRRHRRRQSCAPPRIPPRPRSLCGSLGPETFPLPSSPQPSDAPFQGLTPEGEEDSNWWDEFVAFAGLYDSPLTDPARTPDQAEETEAHT